MDSVMEIWPSILSLFGGLRVHSFPPLSIRLVCAHCGGYFGPAEVFSQRIDVKQIQENLLFSALFICVSLYHSFFLSPFYRSCPNGLTARESLCSLNFVNNIMFMLQTLAFMLMTCIVGGAKALGFVCSQGRRHELSPAATVRVR